MSPFRRLWSRLLPARPSRPSRTPRLQRSGLRLESLESRALLASDTLPVLMVISDQRDFYYTEYHDTRVSLEAAGLDVTVAARTTQRSIPHWNSGQGFESDGGVTPDLALADVQSSDYSAIVFVGGWGSSMYQYAFPGNYGDDLYDGDLATKEVVNQLINDFVAEDKYVAAICHGVTVLAWARVDGVSPLAGHHVASPFIGSPVVEYGGQWYGYFQLGQYEQIVANGGIASTASGQIGDPTTVADDVVVDGKIITAENYDAALMFGQVVAQQVLAAAQEEPPPANQAPVVANGQAALQENLAAGASVGFVAASDPDAGQTLSYAIVGGNVDGAFAIHSTTGEVTVANSAALDFETRTTFELQIEVRDNGLTPLSATAVFTVQLLDELEMTSGSAALFGGNLYVQGTAADDTMYVWSSGLATRVAVWLNGTTLGAFQLGPGGRVVVYGGAGNDRIFATDTYAPTSIYGEAGHDQITGGYADDLLDGGDGVDRLWGSAGNDVLVGGDGNDFLYGREGNDVLFGGNGDDCLDGYSGDDQLVGGFGVDRLLGGDGKDELIGGRSATEDDLASDVLCGAADADRVFAGALDALYADGFDLVTYL